MFHQWWSHQHSPLSNSTNTLPRYSLFQCNQYWDCSCHVSSMMSSPTLSSLQLNNTLLKYSPLQNSSETIHIWLLQTSNNSKCQEMVISQHIDCPSSISLLLWAVHYRQQATWSRWMWVRGVLLCFINPLVGMLTLAGEAPSIASI